MANQNIASRFFSRFIGIAVIVAAVMGFKYYKKSGSEKETLAKVTPMVQQLANYDENAAKIDEKFMVAHKIAFKVSYKMGGRRKADAFDHSKYVSVLFGVMHQLASMDGDDTLAASIVKYTTDASIGLTKVENLEDLL